MNMAGTYTCTTTVGNQSVSASTDVVIYPSPTANFNFTPTCLGAPTQFTSTSTTNPSGQSMSYNWNFGDGQTSTQQHPSHTYTNSGSYSVTLTVTTGGHCTNSKTQTVTVNAQPAANAGLDQTIPYNSSTQLSGSGGAGTFNYHWEPANMVANPNSQNTQTVLLTQDQTYTLTVTNSQGQCTDTDEVTVHIEGSALTVTAEATPASICLGGSTQLTANAGGGMGNSTYSWSPTTGLSDPNIYNPIASPTQTTTYTCTVHNAQTNQTATATVTVVVNEVIVEHEYGSICQGDAFPWHGSQYTAAGTYLIDTVTDQGCEKTLYLHLEQFPTYDETTIDTAICYNESFTFYGTTYNINTNPYYTYYTDQTQHGCDSIVRLNLTVWEDQSPVNPIAIPVCPDQLPYYYNDDPSHTPLNEGLNILYLEDNHGCEKTVKIDIQVSDYYIPPTDTVYVGYYDSPSYDWHIPEANGSPTITYTTEGLHTDTLQTSACPGIFTLDLHFREIPETTHIYDTVCDSYDWYVGNHRVGTYTSNTTASYSIPMRDDLNNPNSPQYMYYDPSNPSTPIPCTIDYTLHLVVNHKSVDNPVTIDCNLPAYDTVCNSYPFFDSNLGLIPFENDTIATLSGLTPEGCEYKVQFQLKNLKYTPVPENIKPNSASTIWFGLPEDQNVPDTAMCAAVITNTEFFSFQYTFFVQETGNSLWDECVWTISKPSWQIEQQFGADRKSSFCTVYIADRDEDYVKLTATAKNTCGEMKKTFYLKSSFLDVDENELAPANVNIVPNPNNGQMHIDFENMEGRTAVKVFDMTGNQIDAFETHVNSNRYNYEYNMKRYAEGIYFFVISNNNRVLTKKVVIIR